MIYFDKPRRLFSNSPRLRRFKITSHCSSNLIGEEGTRELLAFGQQIGLREAWLQHRATAHEHFDLFDGAIDRARQAGAVQVSQREWFRLCVRAKLDAGMPRKR